MFYEMDMRVSKKEKKANFLKYCGHRELKHCNVLPYPHNTLRIVYGMAKFLCIGPDILAPHLTLNCIVYSILPIQTVCIHNQSHNEQATLYTLYKMITNKQ